MEEGDNDQVERHPRQIEDGCRAHTRNKAANTVEVAQWLKTGFRIASEQWQPDGEIVDAPHQTRIENGTDARKRASANDFEGSLAGVEQQHEHG